MLANEGFKLIPVTFVVSNAFTGGANFVSGKRSAGWYAQVERKQRSVGSPFGFGLSPGDFSARQWSILAALGLTRMR